MAENTLIAGRPRTLGSLLRSPYHRLARAVYGCLEEAGYADVRPAHSAVFRHLPADGARITTLAEQADMTKQSMAYLVGYLEQAGYVCLQPDPLDGRAKRVRLTDRGEAVVEALHRFSAAAERRLVERMGASRVAQLRELLAEAEQVLDSPPPPADGESR